MKQEMTKLKLSNVISKVCYINCDRGNSNNSHYMFVPIIMKGITKEIEDIIKDNITYV